MKEHEPESVYVFVSAEKDKGIYVHVVGDFSILIEHLCKTIMTLETIVRVITSMKLESVLLAAKFDSI